MILIPAQFDMKKAAATQNSTWNYRLVSVSRSFFSNRFLCPSCLLHRFPVTPLAQRPIWKPMFCHPRKTLIFRARGQKTRIPTFQREISPTPKRNVIFNFNRLDRRSNVENVCRCLCWLHDFCFQSRIVRNGLLSLNWTLDGFNRKIRTILTPQS